MTQIKQEPCDYDETYESKQVATCIEINDPLDIKLEPVLIKSEPVLDNDKLEESEVESEKQPVPNYKSRNNLFNSKTIYPLSVSDGTKYSLKGLGL